MPRDRLSELKVRYQAVNGDASSSQPKEKVDILDSFLEKVNEASGLLNEISQNIEQIKAYQLRILSSPNADPRNSALLDEHMKNVKNLSIKVSGELKELEDSVQSTHLLPTDGIDRIKSYQHAALLKRFRCVMDQYNQSQLEYRDKCKSRIKLQLHVAGTDVTDDNVEDMLESNNPCVFTNAIMEQTTAAKQSLMEIEARHADILKLERSIEEMKDMFTNIALLVDQQGDLLNNVEFNVGLAVDKVDNAKKEITKANETKRKTRKRKIICFVILAVFILILIITLASALGAT